MFNETLLLLRHSPFPFSFSFLRCDSHRCLSRTQTTLKPTTSTAIQRQRALETTGHRRSTAASASGLENPQPLDLTEDNVRRALAEARLELSQLFDDSVGITGQAELAELDGPFVKISLKGRFWHKRSTVVARLANYLKQRIPEILEVDIEDERQLDDSPASF